MQKYILIVDDEAPIRDLLAQSLAIRGYRTIAAGSALEAREAVKKEAPGLIISDLQLEDADGLEMIGQFKATLPHTPVILLTGVLFDPQVISDILKNNVSAYLEKTSSLARILGEVERLMGAAEHPRGGPGR